jgi:hypothetical protein
MLVGTKVYNNNHWEHQAGFSFFKVAYLTYYAPSKTFLIDSTCLKPYVSSHSQPAVWLLWECFCLEVNYLLKFRWLQALEYEVIKFNC